MSIKEHPSYSMLSPRPMPEALHNKILSFTNIKDNSRKNAWVKLTSGGGLTIVSNPNIPTFGVKSIHGSLTSDAPIGIKDWAGVGSTLDSNSNVGYRPRPIIESVEIKNGKMGISRKATISMKVFSLDQLEQILPYFLEPGMSIFIEWGWNTAESIGQICRSVTEMALANNDVNTYRTKRENGVYEYENYLGTITGGGFTFSDNSWDITIQTVGIGQLAKSLEKTGGSVPWDKNTEAKSDTQTQQNLWKSIVKSVSEVTTQLVNAGVKMWTSFESYFKQRGDGTDWNTVPFIDMYGYLPSEFQIEDVRNLEKDPIHKNHWNFVGFGQRVNEELNGGVFDNMVLKTVGKSIDEQGAFGVELNGEQLVDTERFIRFGTLMKIMELVYNKYYNLKEGISAENSNNPYSLMINTNNVPISAFYRVFSKDKTKLLIMNSILPDFGFVDTFTNPKRPAIYEIAVLDPKIRTIDGAFTDNLQKDEFGNTYGWFPSNLELIGGQYDAKPYYWGYLHNLYVNFDFAMEVLTKSGVTYHDMLLEILNGMSSAVNNLWDFQIVENDIDGKVQQTVVDMNFVGFKEEVKYGSFTHTGANTPFKSVSYSMDIPAAMTNQIVARRATAKGDNDGLSTNPSLPPIDPVLWKSANVDGSKIVDLLATLIPKSNPSNDGGKPSKEPTADEIKSANAIQFVRNAGIFTKIYNPDDVGDNSKMDNLIKTNKLFAGTFNDAQIFDNLRSIDLGREKQMCRVLLPISFDFTTLGVGGIEFGHCFKVDDLISKFRDAGVFQIKDMTHNIKGNDWEISVETLFRPIN